MTLSDVLATAIRPAYALLPERMASASATAMLLAIGLQESRFRHRAQIGGPARGFWQFELGGLRGVLRHQASREPARAALERLHLPVVDGDLLERLRSDDVLAAVFARLLLWTLPDALPGPEDADEGWRQYLAAWRPGKPHPETWAAFYAQAWEARG